MKNRQSKTTHIVTHQRRGISVLVRLSVVGILALVGMFGMSQQVQAAQTPTKYCDQYARGTDEIANAMRNACSDGLKIANGTNQGMTCQDYETIYADQTIADICTKASEDRKATIDGTADIVGAGTVEATKSPSPSATPSATPNRDTYKKADVQNALDETKSLEDYIDVLHQSGPDAKVKTDEKDDSRCESYVNGAGKQQKIKTYPPLETMNPACQNLSGSAPAILFFNGGGWHANDGNSDKVMGNIPDRGDRTQTGPTAGQRGYVGFDITYRLGSSGVYYMFEDVMRGIKHVRDNAKKYGIDPNKIVIWGDSAGGSLSARANASGKSGAKVAVGWSAPTNGYTAIFKSYKSLMIGMDHSTCIPTDLAGLTNATDLLTGGSGDVAQYGEGLASNDFSDIGLIQDNSGFHFDAEKIGSTGAINVITQVLTAGNYAMQSGQNLESISQQIKSGGGSLSGGLMNLSTKKLIECLDNFKALSPALYASPDSSPMFLAGFTTDDVVDPQQAYDMRDKLLALGIRSDASLIPGDANAPFTPLGPNEGNHLDYDARFVCDTLNFIDSVIQPDKAKVDCQTGHVDNSTGSNGSGNTDSSGGSAGSSSGSNSSSGSSGSSGSSNGSSSSQGQKTETKPVLDYATLRQKCLAANPSFTNQTAEAGKQAFCDKYARDTAAGGSLYSSGGYTSYPPVKGQCPSGGTLTANGSSCSIRLVAPKL